MNIFHEILSGATKYPERLAIVEHDQDYTYRQLLDAASQVAQKYLQCPSPNVQLLYLVKRIFIISYTTRCFAYREGLYSCRCPYTF